MVDHHHLAPPLQCFAAEAGWGVVVFGSLQKSRESHGPRNTPALRSLGGAGLFGLSVSLPHPKSTIRLRLRFTPVPRQKLTQDNLCPEAEKKLPV